ncbi:MAG: putative lipase [Pseudomonas sp.]|nr:putative lipase [Pseudomonas sp.]
MALQNDHFTNKMLTCPLRQQWVSVRLVDEFGSGNIYGGLAYVMQDSTGQRYEGILDATGYVRLENCYRGPVLLTFNTQYVGDDDYYAALKEREFYPLPITELQVRAEETRFFHKDGFRVEHNPAQKDADEFFQVEVRDLVEHGAHLPPVAKRFYPPRQFAAKAMSELKFGPEESASYGVYLMPNKHTVLEVRPMRALRPVLSTDDEFCALNLYQLAIMATLSYSDFGQVPSQPVDKVRFPHEPSSGNLFGEALSSYREAWQVDADQAAPYYPIYEDVPYSKRFEILPFDPALYPQNDPALGEDQEHPANQHYFDNGIKRFGGDTQAFICHHDEVILITVRGTASNTDILRDIDAKQVPFKAGRKKEEEEKDTRPGEGKAHRGFYNAYLSIQEFVQGYLSRFYSGQKVIICGHSLGGSIATLLAQALRLETTQKYDVLLYTYGSPRAGDADFVTSAKALVHHRIVNNNDPVPSVPSAWMDAEWKILLPSALGLFGPYGWLMFAFGLVRIGGEPYQHHGKQKHFMPVKLSGGEMSSVLWDPECAAIEHAGLCKFAHEHNKLQGDMPDRAGFFQQIVQNADHLMVGSYIPLAWATLRRWQETLERNQTVVTDREYQFVKRAIKQLVGEIQEEKMRPRSRPINLRQREDEPYDPGPHLEAERIRLNTTLDRLGELHGTRLTPAKIYGTAAQSENLEHGLKRWLTHKENNVKVQIAAIPSRPDNVYFDGDRQSVDPDPMG